MKKALAMLLSMALVLSFVLTGCGEKPTDGSAPPDSPSPSSAGEAKLTDGIYEETTIGLKTFYRFNEDGTYYALFFGGGVIEAGTYEVVDKETKYRTEGLSEEESRTAEPSETAPQTIVTTSYQGGVTEIAYANDTLQDCELGGMAGYRFLHHNAEYNYVAADEEQPLPIYTFYADNKSGNSLTLYHSKTFIDYTGDVGVEGTWEKTSEFAFSLTDENGNTATLAIDGDNAIYGDKTLSNKIVNEGEPIVINSYRVDETEVGLPMPVDFHIDCFSDGTCTANIYVSFTDQDIPLDEGTFTVDEAYGFHFQFKAAGAVEGVPDYATATADNLTVNVAFKPAMDLPQEDGSVIPLD